MLHGAHWPLTVQFSGEFDDGTGFDLQKKQNCEIQNRNLQVCFLSR